MLIWNIEMFLNLPSIVDGSETNFKAQLTDEQQTVIQGLDRETTLAIVERAVHAGSVEGTLSEYMLESLPWGQTQMVKRYDPPILYAKDSVWAACQGFTTTNLAQFQFRIGYTLERVSSEEFIAALVD